jgi:hypothetical protein
LTEPPTAKSTSSAVTSSGTQPADWYASSTTYAPAACAAATDPLDVLDLRRLEEHVLHGHEQRPLVDRRDDIRPSQRRRAQLRAWYT